MLHRSVKLLSNGFTFPPCNCEPKLSLRQQRRFFIFTKTRIWKLILYLRFLALKNTQRYRVLILEK